MEIYVVRSGDTLFRIAARTGLDAVEIARYNEIDPEAPLVPGQTLVLLYPNRTHTVAQGAHSAGDHGIVGAVQSHMDSDLSLIVLH